MVSQKLSRYNSEVHPGYHILNPIVNMMPTVNLQKRKTNRKKPTPKGAISVKIEPDAVPEENVSENLDSDSTVGNEALDIETQTTRLPQLRQTTSRLAKTRSAQNIKSKAQVVSTKELLSNTVKTKGKTADSLKRQDASSSSSVKGVGSKIRIITI